MGQAPAKKGPPAPPPLLKLEGESSAIASVPAGRSEGAPRRGAEARQGRLPNALATPPGDSSVLEQLGCTVPRRPPSPRPAGGRVSRLRPLLVVAQAPGAG